MLDDPASHGPPAVPGGATPLGARELIEARPLVALAFGALGVLAGGLPFLAGLAANGLCPGVPYDREWPVGVAGYAVGIILVSVPVGGGLLACGADSARRGRLSLQAATSIWPRLPHAMGAAALVIVPGALVTALVPPALILAIPLGYALWAVVTPLVVELDTETACAGMRLAGEREQASELARAYARGMARLIAGLVAVFLALWLLGQAHDGALWPPAHGYRAWVAVPWLILSAILGLAALLGAAATALLATAAGVLELAVGYERAATRAGLRPVVAGRRAPLPLSPLLRQARRSDR